MPSVAARHDGTAQHNREVIVRITLASVMVEDQDRALRSYTTILGFQRKNDISMGEFRWLTVSSPEGVAGAELVLEPLGFPPARVYQKALFEAGVPATASSPMTSPLSTNASRSLASSSGANRS